MKSVKKYAPVLIGTLNRYDHFKRCVESLKNCIYSNETHLFIALDYPPSEKHCSGYNKIQEYIDSGINGFKEVTIIKRKENLGAHENFYNAQALIFEKYDRIIISEDDNEFSLDFLNFINGGLDTYEKRSDILAICGYIYPLNFRKKPDHIFLYQGFSAWGYGTWRDKFRAINWNIDEVKEYLLNKDNVKKITSKHVLSHLKRSIRINKLGGDTYICYHLFRNNMSCIFSNTSRVRNHGYDGSGLHCDSNNVEHLLYQSQILFDSKEFYSFPNNPLLDSVTQQEIDNYLRKEIWYYRYLKYPHRILPKLSSKIMSYLRKKWTAIKY
ncbi:MAG: hypothetical protein L3K52_17775 [Candidatus Thiothrix sulfatifontis]|nr:MAG: hypothetical protein L3K52_17775 [Candidatus Thiothrix sulfatifontis]